MKRVQLFSILALLTSLSSCALAKGIFKAGELTGIIIVVVIIGLVIFILAKIFGGGGK